MEHALGTQRMRLAEVIPQRTVAHEDKSDPAAFKTAARSQAITPVLAALRGKGGTG
jgi:hypothetical protein